MKELKPKVSIIGCGNVGLRYAYALLIKGIAREIVLVDPNREKLIGEVKDMAHGAPYVSPVNLIAGDYTDIKDSDLVVITAGKKQKEGQTRIDLLKDNVGLFKTIIPEVMKYSADAIFLIVSNPVDILSYAAYKLSQKPHSQILGSGTVLDSARFRYLLANHCLIDPHNIHAYILGEHGDSEFAVWSKAMIGGVLFDNYCPTCRRKTCTNSKEQLNDIFEEVKNSAYDIIKRKGETSFGIGLALVRITQAILKDENAVLPVSSLVRDYLGINDVYLSLPAVVNRNGIRDVLNIDFNDEEKQKLAESAEKLKKVIKEIGI